MNYFVWGLMCGRKNVMKCVMKNVTKCETVLGDWNVGKKVWRNVWQKNVTKIWNSVVNYNILYTLYVHIMFSLLIAIDYTHYMHILYMYC